MGTVMGLFEKIKSGLEKTRASVSKQVDNLLKSFVKIDEDFFEELEELLIMGDVGVGTTGGTTSVYNPVSYNLWITWNFQNF